MPRTLSPQRIYNSTGTLGYNLDRTLAPNDRLSYWMLIPVTAATNVLARDEDIPDWVHLRIQELRWNSTFTVGDYIFDSANMTMELDDDTWGRRKELDPLEWIEK